MSVMGFQKKLLGRWVSEVSSIQLFLGILFNFAKPLRDDIQPEGVAKFSTFLFLPQVPQILCS